MKAGLWEIMLEAAVASVTLSHPDIKPRVELVKPPQPVVTRAPFGKGDLVARIFGGESLIAVMVEAPGSLFITLEPGQLVSDNDLATLFGFDVPAPGAQAAA